MSCRYASPQNGKVERIIHIINNMLYSLFFQASIPACYWIEGLHTVTYLLNRLPTKAIGMTNTYFTLHGGAPSYEHLCVFTYACYPNLSIKVAHKLAPSPPDVFFSDTLLTINDTTLLTTKIISVLISPPTTSSSLNTLFLMMQISPSMPRPSNKRFRHIFAG
jgi:hypothetical protein